MIIWRGSRFTFFAFDRCSVCSCSITKELCFSVCGCSKMLLGLMLKIAVLRVGFRRFLDGYVLLLQNFTIFSVSVLLVILVLAH